MVTDSQLAVLFPEIQKLHLPGEKEKVSDMLWDLLVFPLKK